MVYSNKFVMVVLIDGQPQEELANGTVKLPFGQEYSLRFRNKNNRRAVVKIYVDGENVSGGGYVINANDHIDIKRHHDIDRAFKFVELNSPEAVDAGKNGPNPDKSKGLIEAHFYLEKERTYVPYQPIRRYEEHHHHHHYQPAPINPYPWNPIRPLWVGDTGDPYRVTCDNSSAQYSSGDINKTCSIGGQSLKMSDSAPQNASLNASPASHYDGDDIAQFKRVSLRSRKTSESTVELCSNKTDVLRDGCTVEGGSTGQQFSSVWIDLEDNYTILKVFLQGFEDDHVYQADAPAKKRKTNKDVVIDDLEAENERLRKELAEIENAKLKEQLAETKKPKKAAKKKKPKAQPKKA